MTTRERVAPRLLAISDRGSLPGSFEDWLGELDGKVDALQIREKDLTDRALEDLARRTRSAFPGTLLINGRVDVALAAACDGVHLPTDGVPITALRRRFGQELLIGRSTHHPEEVEAARRAGANYVVFGPVFPTPSKASYGPPLGLAGLRQAVACGLPVLAIGGIGPDEMAEVAAVGAAGVAAIRALQTPGPLAHMARQASLFWPSASTSGGL